MRDCGQVIELILVMTVQYQRTAFSESRSFPQSVTDFCRSVNNGKNVGVSHKNGKKVTVTGQRGIAILEPRVAQ